MPCGAKGIAALAVACCIRIFTDNSSSLAGEGRRICLATLPRLCNILSWVGQPFGLQEKQAYPSGKTATEKIASDGRSVGPKPIANAS